MRGRPSASACSYSRRTYSDLIELEDQKSWKMLASSMSSSKRTSHSSPERKAKRSRR